MQFTATLPVIGMDIAKHVFQLHVVDAQTGEVTRHKLRRDRVTAFFANRQKSLVAMRLVAVRTTGPERCRRWDMRSSCCPPSMFAPLCCATRLTPVMPRPSG